MSSSFLLVPILQQCFPRNLIIPTIVAQSSRLFPLIGLSCRRHAVQQQQARLHQRRVSAMLMDSNGLSDSLTKIVNWISLCFSPFGMKRNEKTGGSTNRFSFPLFCFCLCLRSLVTLCNREKTRPSSNGGEKRGGVCKKNKQDGRGERKR